MSDAARIAEGRHSLTILRVGRFRLSFKAGRASSDPEKLVTPGILYAAHDGGDVIVRLVAIGWWDWHITVLFAHLLATDRKDER